MTDLLPWLILAVLVALAAGYALGRRAPTPAAPADSPLPTPIAIPPSVAAPPSVGTAAPTPVPHDSAAASRNAAPAPGSKTASLLAGARSWGYQLQRLDPKRAAASPHDVLVIDATRDGDEESALTPAEVARLKQKPDGSRRVVLAYLSIGEAESYRAYWRPEWKRQKPAWLLGENPDWEGNYAVCFWDPGWQRLVCGDPQAPLDRILAQGFDGIYLDKCDVVDDLREHFKAAARSRPDLDGDMVGFVHRLAAYARERHPGFLVVMQNAESLLVRKELRRILDGVAKEELLFGLDAVEKPNAREDIAEARRLLDLVRADGKPVLVVEYLASPPKIETAKTEARRAGYVLYVAPKDRELARLNDPV